MQRIHCQDPWFSKIKSGVKKIEGRKRSDKYLSLKPGDLLEFHYKDESFITKVNKVSEYPDLEAYLRSEGFQKALPGVSSLEKAMEIYHSWNDPESLRKSGGFLAIHIQVVSDSNL